MNRSAINVAEAVALYDSGWTLEQLGNRYGVTRERVRQKITALVNHERTRTADCAVCGSRYRIKSHTGMARFCSQECRDIQHRRNVREASRDTCKCGRAKFRMAKVCILCKRTFSHELAAYLYDSGATLKQVAEVLKVKLPTVSKAIEKLCVTHGRGFRRQLEASDVERLAREYMKHNS